MEFFVDLISSIFPFIRATVLAIIPLGFLIFIHELGHFWAAKRCGIKVNTFSIGFGPKIFGIRRGETDYKISYLPFGGYVQMEGENPSEQTGAPGEFASASIGNRAFVVAAGPVVNLLFGILVYWMVFATGLNTHASRLIGGLTGMPLGETEAIQIGWLADEGAGAAGGLMPGDTVISVNGAPIRHWSTLQTRVLTSPGRDLEFIVERDGAPLTLSVIPDAVPSVRGDVGEIRVSDRSETIVEQVRAGSPAAEAGIQTDDLILSINGENLHNVLYFGYEVWPPSEDWINEKYKALYKQINENREALTLGIRRADETLTLEIPVEWHAIASVQDDSVAEAAGIRDGDVLVSINGEPIDVATLYTQLNTTANQPIEITLMRDDKPKTVTLSNETESSETDTETAIFGLKWQTTLSGMQMGLKTAPLPEYDFITGFGKGLEATWLTFTAVGRTLQQLIGGEVSPKHLAGPIGIGNATINMFDRLGLSSLVFFIGFISINLCIVNLLPIPIADGGQLLFFAVEKIRGKPMPRRAQEIVQQVTIVLLIVFFLYVSFFDGMSVIYDLRN